MSKESSVKAHGVLFSYIWSEANIFSTPFFSNIHGYSNPPDTPKIDSGSTA